MVGNNKKYTVKYTILYLFTIVLWWASLSRLQMFLLQHSRPLEWKVHIINSWYNMLFIVAIGTLSNDDDDDNNNVKNKWFYEQNNCSARASSFSVHFFDVHCTTTTWNLPRRRFVEDMDILRKIFPSLFEHGKNLKNSTPGNVAYIWRIKRFQMDAIKFERTQTHF